MNIVDAFVVTFALDPTGYRKGAKEVDEETKRLREGQKKSFSEMEAQGKAVAETVKGLRNEVVGLGLAFLGASSITGLITNMISGAAAADRLGKTMGMSANQVWAWRRAMQSVGGQVGEGDAALQAIQRDKMGYRLGGLDGTKLGTYGRLGISANDLRDLNAGQILQKLAGAQGRLDPQLYAGLLQQIGLPASTVNLLMQGKSWVDKLIKQYEADADGNNKLAKEAEDLQRTLADLSSKLTKSLIPDLRTIANALDKLVKLIPDNAFNMMGGGPYKNAYDYIGDWVGGSTGAWIKNHFGSEGASGRQHGGKFSAHASGSVGGAGDGSVPRGLTGEQAIIGAYLRKKGISADAAMGILAGISGEGGSAYAVNSKSGAFGIGQWLGPRKSELFRRYGAHPSLMQQLEFLWWELNGGDRGGASVLGAGGADATMLAYFAKFMRPQGLHNEHYRDLLADIGRGRRYLAQHVTNHYHIKSHDPKGVAHEIGKLQRRSAVSQSDPGIVP